MVALAPMVAPRRTGVGRNSLLRSISARGLLTLVKTHEGAAEDAVLQAHAVIERDVVLNLAAVAEHDVAADHDVLPDDAVPPDPAVPHDVAEMPDAGAGADLAGLVHIGAFVDRHRRVDAGHARRSRKG